MDALDLQRHVTQETSTRSGQTTSPVLRMAARSVFAEDLPRRNAGETESELSNY